MQQVRSAKRSSTPTKRSSAPDEQSSACTSACTIRCAALRSGRALLCRRAASLPSRAECLTASPISTQPAATHRLEDAQVVLKVVDQGVLLVGEPAE